jgi:hypothetical protein
MAVRTNDTAMLMARTYHTIVCARAVTRSHVAHVVYHKHDMYMYLTMRARARV